MPNAGAYLPSWFGRFKVVPLGRPDPWLWLPAAALTMLGSIMVLDTTYFLSAERAGDALHFFKLHVCHIAVGLLAMVVFSHLSRTGLRRMVLPLALLAMAMLAALWVPGLGMVRGGARRWLKLGPLIVQPSEVFKLATVFFLADFLSRHRDRMQAFKGAPLQAFILVGLPGLLILKEPDFGTTVIVAATVFVMLYIAGMRLPHLGAAAGCVLAGLCLQFVGRSYRMRRLEAFIHPWQAARGVGFQLIQSFIAFGAGGEWGAGLGAGRQKMFYLPQSHTDFVFAVIGEELGLVGAIAVLALFCVLVFRGMLIAREETDAFSSLLAAGLTSLLALEVLVNVAVVVGLLPTKGLPLPFVSYGGTAMVSSMTALGVLLSLGRRRPAAQ